MGNHLDPDIGPEAGHHGKKRRKKEPLPARMQVRLDLVDEEDDPVGLGLPQELRRALVLLPGPDEQIGERDHALHPRRGEDEGDRSIRHLESRMVPHVVEAHARRVSGAKLFLLTR